LKNLALFPTALAVADEICRRRIAHVHAYWLSGASTVALVAAMVARVTWSYSAHSWDIFMANNLIAEKVRSAHFGRAISQLGRSGIALRSGESLKASVEVIHLGVLANGAPKAAEHLTALRSVRILCPTAMLIPVKGQEYLLQALRLIIDAGLECSCVLTGEGPLRSKLAQSVRSLRLEDVVSIPGRLPHATLLKQLHAGAYDMVVLPSIERGSEFEGIPVSLMEAMAAGVPCIATKTGAIGELIDGDCGVLVNQRDPVAISGAVLELASNPAWREAIRTNAFHRIAEQFNARKSAKMLADLISRSATFQN
jgi:colanic acid/amylovoran biosynthesis glycosyltransferase